MCELRITIPTYYRKEAPGDGPAHYGEPTVPILIRWADALRVVFGAHDHRNTRAPDLLIERRPGGWALFLHPAGGDDPSGCVYFLDDGRGFLVPESEPARTPPIVVVNEPELPMDIDDGTDDRCRLCGEDFSDSQDGWNGLCATCADRVSQYLDDHHLTDEDCDRAIDALRRRV